VSFRQKLVAELKSVGSAMLFFAAWIAMLVSIKQLVLAEYHIAFGGISVALIGALILSKVVVVLEHVPLGNWIRTQPAWIDVIARTVLYALGLFVVILLEKAFEGRHEFGGFGAALAGVFEHADMPHVWANTICLSGALLVYNLLSVIRKYSPDRTLLRILLLPLPDESGTRQPDHALK
jgi:hypothetical protein